MAAILFIVMVSGTVAAMIAPALFRSYYAEDLNKNLSVLLDNPEITPKYYASYISGTYHGHSVTLEWSITRYSVSMYVKIHNLNIPALEANYPSDLSAKQSNTANLWQDLSNLCSVQEIRFTDHTLQIEMRWFKLPVDKKTGMLLIGPSADSLHSIDPAHITQEVSVALDKILKILELLS